MPWHYRRRPRRSRSDLDPAQRFDAEAIRAAGDNAVALARINARTREAEAGLRKSISGSGGGGGKNDPATALIKTLEQYRSRAEIASIRLQGSGAGEEARLVATAEAARLAEAAIAKIGDNPAAVAQVRELEAAVSAAAEEAIAIERALSRGPQGVDAIRSGLRGYVEEATFAGNEIESAVGGAFRNLEDALVQFVQSGKLEVGDLVNSIIADFARIAIRQNITGPLADALSGALAGSARAARHRQRHCGPGPGRFTQGVWPDRRRPSLRPPPPQRGARHAKCLPSCWRARRC